jgi:hypothetical protein
MVNLTLSTMRIGGVFFTMKIFLYITVLSALMTFLPQVWHAPVLILNGLFVCLFMIKQTKNKRKAVWLSLLLMVIVVLIVYPESIRYLGKLLINK